MRGRPSSPDREWRSARAPKSHKNESDEHDEQSSDGAFHRSLICAQNEPHEADHERYAEHRRPCPRVCIPSPHEQCGEQTAQHGHRENQKYAITKRGRHQGDQHPDHRKATKSFARRGVGTWVHSHETLPQHGCLPNMPNGS